MSAERNPDLIKFKASSPRYDGNITVKNGDKGMIEQTALVVSVESGLCMGSAAAKGRWMWCLCVENSLFFFCLTV